jgi:hypothetical protein
MARVSVAVVVRAAAPGARGALPPAMASIRMVAVAGRAQEGGRARGGEVKRRSAWARGGGGGGGWMWRRVQAGGREGGRASGRVGAAGDGGANLG